MIVLWLPFVVCVLGLILFLLCNKPEQGKVSKVGEIMFWVGLLVTLAQLPGHLVGLLR